MRSASLLACSVLAVLGPFAAAAPGRKGAPTRVERAAGDAFTRATAAEDQGHLSDASDLYVQSFDLSPHPNTAFNIARVNADNHGYVDAVTYYEIYLALAPTANDRAAVEATIEALRKVPGTLQLRTQDSSGGIDLTLAYVLVDGAIVSKPGSIKSAPRGRDVPSLKLTLAPGFHTIDVVGEFTYFGDTMELTPGGRRQLDIQGGSRKDGDVVIQLGEDMRGDVGDIEIDHRGGRIPLTPGPHRLKLMDRGLECAPITVDPPKGNTVSYVHAMPKDFSRLKWGQPPFACRPLTITKRTLTF